MSFWDLLKIEFMKVRRSKIVPLIFVAPLLVVISGVASLSNYFTPEYTNAWPAMFIQSALELILWRYLVPVQNSICSYGTCRHYKIGQRYTAYLHQKCLARGLPQKKQYFFRWRLLLSLLKNYSWNVEWHYRDVFLLFPENRLVKLCCFLFVIMVV